MCIKVIASQRWDVLETRCRSLRLVHPLFAQLSPFYLTPRSLYALHYFSIGYKLQK